ncbi:S-Ena type endospore appendage [Bacillus mycoides]|uniref:S-Ena type endospore appendage n=1 Tax=Bacillus mycoides TaxID=1405 RepID=UPI003D6535B3
MSTCKKIIHSTANPACCPNPEVIVTENCQDLINISDTTTPTTIWRSPNSYISFTFFVAPEATSPASLVITNNNATLPAIIVQPGTSVTRTFRGITLITVAATGAGETTSGRMCFKLYKQVTL